jgi:broad specificity phosphatase PhoE
LTEVGKKQVSTTAQAFVEKGLSDKNVRAVYISPLPRTRETAKIITDALQISPNKTHINDHIAEIKMGTWEGKKYEEFPWNSYDFSHGHEYGGETVDDVNKRIKILIDKILSECDRNSNVIIVTHRLPAECIHEYLTGEPNKVPVTTASFFEIPWDKAYSTKTAALNYCSNANKPAAR